jgi:hypothetical protein
MLERRLHPRYILMPPLKGRALVDEVGQVDAELIDVSIDGARLALTVGADVQARLQSGPERSVAATFVRPGAMPWKLTLIHSRLTMVPPAASAAARCLVAGRFVTVPTFGSADLEGLVDARSACCATREGSSLRIRGGATLAVVQSHVAMLAKAAPADIDRVDLSGARLLERDATLAWIAAAGADYPALRFLTPQA